MTYLHAKGHHSDQQLKDQSQRQLPHGRVDVMSRWPVGQSIAVALGNAHVGVVTELRRIQQAAIIKQLRDQLAGAHASVAVGKRQQSCDRCNNQNFQDRVVTQPRRLTPTAPSDVCSDEKGAPDSSKNTQEDEGYQLQQVPRGVEFHIEQHQPAVTERIDGAKGKGSHQRSKERPPQCLQWEIITHLHEKYD